MSRAGIRKGTIVWFWNRVKWSRGKVHAVNKYFGPWWGASWPGIWIKPYNGKPLHWLPLDPDAVNVVDGAMPKPQSELSVKGGRK